MKEGDPIEKKMWTSKQMIIVVFFACSMVFSGALIYAEFILHGKQIKVLEERLDKKIKIINENTDNVNKLKQKGSDE